MTAEDPISHRVECPAPKPAGIDRQQIRNSIEHLSRGFVREGEKQDIARIDSVLEQISHAIRERARLPRACPGDHEQRTGWRGHRCELLLVELRGVIDMDRCRSWCALQHVLTGHLMIAEFGPVTLLCTEMHFNRK